MSRRIARLKPKKIKGRIATLRALPYRENMIYIRMIDKEIFEYIAVFKGQVYSNYMVITPRNGQTKLSKEEIIASSKLILAGAEASIDTLLGETLDKEKAKIVQKFEGSRKSVEEVLPN